MPGSCSPCATATAMPTHCSLRLQRKGHTLTAQDCANACRRWHSSLSSRPSRLVGRPKPVESASLSRTAHGCWFPTSPAASSRSRYRRGHVAGLIASTDVQGGVYKAPAGVGAMLRAAAAGRIRGLQRLPAPARPPALIPRPNARAGKSTVFTLERGMHQTSYPMCRWQLPGNPRGNHIGLPTRDVNGPLTRSCSHFKVGSCWNERKTNE